MVYVDRNYSGDLDDGDLRVAGVQIRILYRETPVAEMRTADDGRFLFDNLEPLIYLLRKSPPAGFMAPQPEQYIKVPPGATVTHNVAVFPVSSPSNYRMYLPLLQK